MSDKFPPDYFSHAQNMKNQLDNVSPTLCLAKWLQVSMHLTTGLTQSCYHPPTHKIPLDEIKDNPKALHNTKEKKNQRKMMLNGQRPAGCDYCWKIEDGPGNYLSDRIIRSNEGWAKPHFDEVIGHPFDHDINPTYVEVNFNHACNLKCSYCSPHLSSTWAAETDDMGPYPTIVPHNDSHYMRKNGMMPIIKKGDNPYVEAFWRWWPGMYNSINTFRMTGGEPLIDKNTFKVLDWIIDNPRPQLELAITSNMCVPDNLFNLFLRKMDRIQRNKMLKSFMLFASIDTYGKQAEYIRFGLNNELFWTNIEQYLDEVQHGMVTFILTMNCLSLPNIKRFLERFLQLQEKFNINDHHRIFLDCPFLRDPKWMSLQILPDQYHHFFDDAISFMKLNSAQENSKVGFRNFWIGKMERTRAWMKQTMNNSDLIQARVNFHRFFKEYDKRKQLNFLSTFPEYSEFWALCEAESKSYDINTRNLS